MQPLQAKFKVREKLAWEPLALAIQQGATLIQAGQIEELFLGIAKENWGDSRYVHITLEEGRWKLQLSMNGDSHFAPGPDGLSLCSLGWEEGGLNDMGPVCLLPQSTNMTQLGWAVISALQLTNTIHISSWFTFGNIEQAKSLNQSHSFWHHKVSREIFCLPGQNFGFTQESDF